MKYQNNRGYKIKAVQVCVLVCTCVHVYVLASNGILWSVKMMKVLGWWKIESLLDITDRQMLSVFVGFTWLVICEYALE